MCNPYYYLELVISSRIKGKKAKQKNPSEIPYYKNITPATELKSQVLSKYEYKKSMK